MINQTLKQLQKKYYRQFKHFFSSKQWQSKKFRRKIYGLLFLSLIIGLFFWNWILLLATSAGVGMMAFVYLLQGWNLQFYQDQLANLLRDSNQRLTIAVGLGGLSAFVVYLITTIWLTSPNRWLATGEILQGLITLLIGGLLLISITDQQKVKNKTQFRELLDNLTSSNHLKRLIAIRKLTDLFLEQKLSQSQTQQLNDYFQIMLSYESEIILQKALLESLEQLNFEQKPLQIPLNLRQSNNKVKLKQTETLDILQ